MDDRGDGPSGRGDRNDATGGGTDGADRVVVERLPPEEAFELLAHETRVRTLAELDRADEPLAFGDLRERVGVDDPGGFNYHVRKLDGRFVVGGEEGYRLTAAGRRVVGAVRSGGYTKRFAGETVETDDPCRICDGNLAVEFDEGRVRIRCANCECLFTEPRIPPAVLEGVPVDEVPALVDRWLKRDRLAAAYGFCRDCDGHLDQQLCLPGDEAAPVWFHGFHSKAVVMYTCRRCGHWWHWIVEKAVVTHPVVAAFHHEHGIDVRETPDWELDWLEYAAVSVASEDPLRVDVSVTLDGDTRVFRFDDELTLVESREE